MVNPRDTARKTEEEEFRYSPLGIFPCRDTRVTKQWYYAAVTVLPGAWRYTAATGPESVYYDWVKQQV